MLPKEVIEVFLHLSMKNTIERPNKRESPSNKPYQWCSHDQARLCQIEKPQLLQHLSPTNNIKN